MLLSITKRTVNYLYLNKQYAKKYSSKKEFFRELDTFKEGLQREIDMQNKVIFSAATLVFGSIGGLYVHMNDIKNDNNKKFEQVDKRFEHLEKEVGEIKSILKEMNSKK